MKLLKCPLEILHSLYLDLVEGDLSRGGFMIKELPKHDRGTLGNKLSIIFNFATSLTPSGWICLEVSGEQKQGSEAVTSVLIALV